MIIHVNRPGASADLPIGPEEKDLYLGLMAAADFISEIPSGQPPGAQVIFYCRDAEDISRLCKSFEEIVALWVTGAVEEISLDSPAGEP